MISLDGDVGREKTIFFHLNENKIWIEIALRIACELSNIPVDAVQRIKKPKM